MQEKRFRELLARFAEARVMVVGDIYLDENVYGVMTGVSLEAPVPVLEIRERLYNPGAAGNAACNVASLGAATFMVGVVGADTNADIVKKEFAVRNVDTSHVVVDPTRPTNTYGKLRAAGFNAPSQEVLRTDTPTQPFITGDVEDRVIANIRALAGQVDAIVVVDQVSSVVTDRVLREIVGLAKKHKLLTVGDSRQRAGAFEGFDVLVPNDREAGIGAGIEVTNPASMRAAGEALRKVARNVLVTRGPEGITVFAESGEITDVPITPRDVVDVTGAGDTVTATVTLAHLAGASLVEAAMIGNAAAGVAVTKRGAVTVSQTEVTESMLSGYRGKERTLSALKEIVRQHQSEGRSVVWTNGCFDILHAGHITYLLRAAELGDILIVGLNSDASVRRVKGPSRPIVNEDDRALVLSALECVNYVTVFEDETTVPILEALKPDVYAKGGDYTIDTINQDERRIVEGYGGAIALLPGVEGQSTTAIIDKIAKTS